jgi:ubiquitin-protein ligase
VDLLNWEVGIIPPPTSAFALPEGDTLRLLFTFSSDYPSTAPTVRFTPPIFHTNVWPDGRVCLSLLLPKGHHADAKVKHSGHWVPSLTVADLLVAMTTFLDEPNPHSIANAEACAMAKKSLAGYEAEARRRMKAYRPPS